MTLDPRRGHQSGLSRVTLLDQVAGLVPAGWADDCVLIGVDGVDGSGKTTFADELAAALYAAGRCTLRISVDDFHHVRDRRYRLGRESPEGFWLDSFDYERLHMDVLQPLGPGGSRRFRSKAHDLETDQVVWPARMAAPAGAVVVVDGLFLHRAELVDAWAFTIFLDVPFEVTARRMAERDGSNPDPKHPSLRRYVEAQRHYLAECTPAQRASLVIDNSRFADPRVLGPQGDRGATA
jgi:uridine kinase